MFIKNNFKLSILFFSFINGATIFGCSWCKKLENKNEIIINANFKKDYLEKYFPKAFVITEEYFSQMCPLAVEKSLNSIVKMLANKTYFYFQNKPKGFNFGEHLENILEQLKIIYNFLNYSKVDLKLNLVFNQSIFDFFNDDENPNEIKLFNVWKQSGKDRFYDFYAFYYDCLVIMFLEGIKSLDLSLANKYYSEITKIFDKIRSSKYEASRNEMLKKYKELLEILKTKKKNEY